MKYTFKYALLISTLATIISCTNTPNKQNLAIAAFEDSVKNDVVVNPPVQEEKELDDKTEFDSISCGLNFTAGKSYSSEKYKIEKLRSDLIVQYQNAADTLTKNKLLDSAMLLFTNSLLNRIIPYWYGTTWDFNGYTAKPKQGTIACGYFVSTTLRDMGLNLNRYKLAKQGPENEAKSIAINTNEILYTDLNNITSKLKSLEDGIYFIGLDNHVGYLFLENNVPYFIHSNYLDGKVMIETVESSEAFHSSDYYISNISINRALMLSWLKKDEIQVITE